MYILNPLVNHHLHFVLPHMFGIYFSIYSEFSGYSWNFGECRNASRPLALASSPETTCASCLVPAEEPIGSLLFTCNGRGEVSVLRLGKWPEMDGMVPRFMAMRWRKWSSSIGVKRCSKKIYGKQQQIACPNYLFSLNSGQWRSTVGPSRWL